MQKIITGNSVIFMGPAKNLKNLFQDFPPETTLKDYIKKTLQ